MRFRLLTLLLVLAPLVPSAPVADAAVPDTFSNLEVLPPDTGRQEMLEIMKGFTADLGLRCSDCHVQKVPGDFDSFDWASDEHEEKRVAREMMKMVQRLNAEVLPAATGGDDASVGCVTCHRGLKNPATLDRVLLETARREGIDAVEERYRALRERYYGSGSYDFSPSSLAGVATGLAESGDLAGARRVAELNLEMNPDYLRGHLELAQIELAAGDKAAAKAAVEKVLAADPQNERALRLLKRIGG